MWICNGCEERIVREEYGLESESSEEEEVDLDESEVEAFLREMDFR
jgi:hypothetical protein